MTTEMEKWDESEVSKTLILLRPINSIEESSVPVGNFSQLSPVETVVPQSIAGYCNYDP